MSALNPLSFRYPGHAHALINALAFGEEGWIITLCAVAEAADGKAWIERKSCLCSGPRLIQRTEQRWCSGEPKMRDGIPCQIAPRIVRRNRTPKIYCVKSNSCCLFWRRECPAPSLPIFDAFPSKSLTRLRQCGNYEYGPRVGNRLVWEQPLQRGRYAARDRPFRAVSARTP